MDIKITTSVSSDITELTWYKWLQHNLASGKDYNILYWQDHCIVDIVDPDNFDWFVSSNSLD
jgi:hypothetical protein